MEQVIDEEREPEHNKVEKLKYAFGCFCFPQVLKNSTQVFQGVLPHPPQRRTSDNNALRTKSRGGGGCLVAFGERREMPVLHLTLHLLPTLEDVSHNVVARQKSPVRSGQREPWSHSVLGVVPVVHQNQKLKSLMLYI